MLKIFELIGRYFMLMGKVFSRPEKAAIYRRRIIFEMESLGVNRSGLLSEAFAELLLHLLADLVDPPAESQHQHDDQNNKSHKKIQDKQRYALEQRGGAERQYDDKERRQRIALHEAHQGVDDCQYEIHSDFGLHLHKGMENYAYFN